MNKKKSISTKEKIKQAALRLFNEQDSFCITTNKIATALNMSPGNLYYHYSCKEEIIRELYDDMTLKSESVNMFEVIINSSNPLLALKSIFEKYGDLFIEYNFLMRDIAVLIRADKALQEKFLQNQDKRIAQISGIIKFLISEELFIKMSPDEIRLRAKLQWFVAAYWQTFDTNLNEASKIGFDILITPLLTKKGIEMCGAFDFFKAL